MFAKKNAVKMKVIVFIKIHFVYIAME